MLRPARRVEVSTGAKDSRFLTLLARAADPSAAGSVLSERSAEHPDATHHCWAYRVWDDHEIVGIGFDAGEPSGTAGRPILGALERAELVQTACVVTRWYGGTKLGTGGLTRAYASAASEAVRAARESGALEPVAPRAVFRVGFDYDATAAVRRVLARFDGRESAEKYGESVEMRVSVALERADGFAEAVSEATGDAARVGRIGARLERM